MRSFRDGDYGGGVNYLRTAISLAKKEGKPSEAVRYGLKLAELLEKAEHPQLAADEMQRILRSYPEEPRWGEIAVKRLMYLYRAGRYSDIGKEATACQKDERCKNNRPHVIYLSWLAARKEENVEEARRLQRTFVRDYPKSDLCADMYFSEAIEALTQSETDRARQLLQLIEDKYPNSSIAKTKVEGLKKGLNSAF